jgi:hypothetical protein
LDKYQAGFFLFQENSMLKLKLDEGGHLVFYICVGCGHVGILATNISLLCQHCQAADDDIDWVSIHIDDLKSDLKFIAEQLDLSNLT